MASRQQEPTIGDEMREIGDPADALATTVSLFSPARPALQAGDSRQAPGRPGLNPNGVRREALCS